MRRLILILSFLLTSGLTFSQFTDGYNQREALEMIAICNSFTFQDVLGTDNPIIPQGYKKIYQSEPLIISGNFWKVPIML